jgi:hypothetical protein
MKYYVSVGRGGVLFRIAMILTGMIGSVVYWRASRRRGAERLMESSSPTRHPGPITHRPATWSAVPSGSGPAKSPRWVATKAGIDRWRRPLGRFISQ